MKKQNIFRKLHTRGFTLIELLVVIAIIGILSSIVIASLNRARERAADAKVKAQIAGAKAAAELFYDRNGSYNGPAGNIAFNCTTVDSLFTDTVDSSMGQSLNLVNYPPLTSIRCSSTIDAYAISASLSNGNFWCIDSSGNVNEVIAASHALAHPDDDTICN